jgi:hypothetical protein
MNWKVMCFGDLQRSYKFRHESAKGLRRVIGTSKAQMMEPPLHSAVDRQAKCFIDTSHFKSWSSLQIWQRSVTWKFLKYAQSIVQNDLKA